MEEKLILGKHNIKILKEVFAYCGHYDVACPRHAGLFDARRAAISTGPGRGESIRIKNSQ